MPILNTALTHEPRSRRRIRRNPARGVKAKDVNARCSFCGFEKIPYHGWLGWHGWGKSLFVSFRIPLFHPCNPWLFSWGSDTPPMN